MKTNKKTPRIDVPNSITSIPLYDIQQNNASGENLLGYINGAIGNVRQIFRGELALAKTEVLTEVKHGLRGSAFFIAAAVILLYSSFFFFLTLGFILYIFLPLWASFLIVFLVMVVFAGLLGFLGFTRFKKVSKPENTITTLKSTVAIPASVRAKEL